MASAARTRRTCRRRIPRRAGPQVQRDRGEVVLRGTSADGASQRVDRGHGTDRSDRLRRTGRRAGDARTAPSPRHAPHRRRGQGLRHCAAGSPTSASSDSRRTWRRTQPTGAARSMDAPPATPAIRSVNGSANGSRSPSGGWRPSPVAASSATSAKRRNRAWFLMTGAVYNILRITALDAATA